MLWHIRPVRITDVPGRLRSCIESEAVAKSLRLAPSQLLAVQALERVQRSRPRGVYLHGPPGTGKTWLLDAATRCSSRPVLRLHWTEFFTRLDAAVGRRLTDPQRLQRSLDEVVGPARVLCFDDLNVTDPDDAGFIEHLLIRMRERRTRVIMTSNQAPKQLLADPNWHHWAAGLIRLLESDYAICRVDDGADFRTLGATSRFSAGRVSIDAAPPADVELSEVISGGRALRILRKGSCLWVHFADLLETPTGRQDYALICRSAETLCVYGIPNLTTVDRESSARFAILVDVAHDLDARLILGTTEEQDWATLPKRTVSRLSLLVDEWVARGDTVIA